MKLIVNVANRTRPAWPNHVSPATTAHSSSAIGIRNACRPGTYAMIALVAAAIEIEIVRQKSTISAPITGNAHAVPNARPAASASPPPSGKRRTRNQ